MLKHAKGSINLVGTKAETLSVLANDGYNVPDVFYFTVNDWNTDADVFINAIIKKFPKKLLAVRSSTLAEDSDDQSMAGAFESLLNVNSEYDDLKMSIEKVIASFDEDINNQVLIQPMVLLVAMSGVIMTQVLDDGSPYYVFNYDDRTGLTDTVTSGSSINKTVYIYNGVDKKDFDSPYLLSALKLVNSLELTFPNIPLDIEFVVDKNIETHLLQVRKITTFKNWKKEINEKVSGRMLFLKEYVAKIMNTRPHLYGDKTLLGFMPDWNPAEMIGVVPHPLSMSLYRKLITKSTWRIAREKMGYRKMPNVDLMVSLFGRAYIDVRNSFNSFLPQGLDKDVGQKLVNAYLNRLDKNPHLHDKIEFEVVHTAYDFDFENEFNKRYKGVLSEQEFFNYRGLLRKITKAAILDTKDSSINAALRDINELKSLQKNGKGDNF